MKFKTMAERTERQKAYRRAYSQKPEVKAKAKIYRQKNRDKIIKYHKEYSQKNKEKLKAKSKEYLQKPEVMAHLIAHGKEYYQKNKEKINAKSRAYHKKNKEKLRLYAKEYLKKNRERLTARMRVYGKKHYQKNRDKIRAEHMAYHNKNRDKILAHNREQYQKMREDFLANYKLGKCCSSCGWKEHPEILQFHHKKGEKKSFTIGNLKLYKKISPEIMEAEIKKCVLLCPNCHLLFHFKRKEIVK